MRYFKIIGMVAMLYTFLLGAQPFKDHKFLHTSVIGEKLKKVMGEPPKIEIVHIDGYKDKLRVTQGKEIIYTQLMNDFRPFFATVENN
jgi:hypothetical protein